MRLTDGAVHYSPSDVRSFMTCQLDTMRGLDALLGRLPQAPSVDASGDPFAERLGDVGRMHQDQVRDEYRERYGPWREGAHGGLRELDGTRANHETAAAAINALQDDGAQAVAQLPVAAGRFYGIADYLVAVGDRWQLVEVRLGLRVKDVYLAQIGALALGLLSRGVPLDADALFIAGNGARVDVPLIEAMDRAREVLAEFDRAIEARLADTEIASWQDDTLAACGWCDTCVAEMTACRDVRLTVGLRMPDRALLRESGIRTIDDLAAAELPIAEFDDVRAAGLRAQARLQVRQMPPGTELDPSLQRGPIFEVYDRAPIDELPAPSVGDVFFDFESDPMWVADGDDARGLHYLFGLYLPREPEPYVAFWAHDRAAEKAAFEAFVRFMRARLRAFPEARVYHYGSYETTVLREVARRFESAETTIDEWIERGVFVDLLPVVKGSLRTSQPGYGLKKIEPLYMGEELRTGAVVDGAASVASYQEFTELREAGERDQAQQVIDEIADYNRYDCLSTLRLRDWLRSLVTDRAAPA